MELPFSFYQCPFKLFFGISCPGCGMTRAFFALLCLDFEKAFYYHPLFPVVILVTVLFLLDRFKIRTFSDRFKNWGLIAIGILFFVTYFIRFYTTPEVVYFHPEEGILFQIYDFISARF